MNRTAKWFLMISILGTTLALAFVASVATQDGNSTSAGSAVPAAAPADVATGGQYRLSSPNELDPDGSSAITASSGPAVYRVSGPNEADPDGAFSGGVAPASAPAYRVSPPNEQNPSGN